MALGTYFCSTRCIFMRDQRPNWKSSSWFNLLTLGLVEVDVDAFELQIRLALVLPVRHDTMFVANAFPKLGSHLVTYKREARWSSMPCETMGENFYRIGRFECELSLAWCLKLAVLMALSSGYLSNETYKQKTGVDECETSEMKLERSTGASFFFQVEFLFIKNEKGSFVS